MMLSVKRIGVLTSGGDCAGLNTAIRAVAQRAIRHYGWTVLGIKNGTLGLMNRPLETVELTPDILAGGLFRMGGTMLGTTNRGDPFAYPMPDGSIRDRSGDFVEGFRMLGLDALIVIGGDGSMHILNKLCRQGNIPMVGIPKTIDNDVYRTDAAIGFSTAVSVVVEALDRLQPTAASHHRVMILEVMGRNSGYIGMYGGVAGGADVILIPEIPYSIDAIVGRIRDIRAEGRSHALVVVAEGCRTEDGQTITQALAAAGGQGRLGGIGQYLAARLEEQVDAEVRVTVLGHLQRGGEPSNQDRLLASSFGVHAVDLVAEGQFDRMVVWQNMDVSDVAISKVVIGARSVSREDMMLQTARGLGIYVGELG